jgi:serine protease inhibitor
MKIKNKIIKENHEEKGYMFINSLKVIKKQVDEMLEMVESTNSEELIRNMMHDAEWAQSHITSSEDDITEVYNYIMGSVDSYDYVEKKEKEFDSYDPEYVNIQENISKIKKFMGLGETISKKKLKTI